ncbi:putative periplasmic lipoprotein [Klebsiella aerogenes]|uniref:hypothetical protein n=1 Tax=Klebsiella aerogenes TaxID=548 RepID=UPI00293088F2|nr:hypothetical protein [Klebsiella aerogenes]
MRKIMVCFIASFLLLGCGQLTDEKVIADVKEKIVKKLSSSYGKCDSYKFLSNSPVPEFKNAYLLHCDNFLNPNDLSFSDVKVYNHGEFTVVCGVVSGRTDLSRQGMRFVEFWDRNDSAEMQSKYSGRRINHILGSPVKTYRDYYQKFCK